MIAPAIADMYAASDIALPRCQVHDGIHADGSHPLYYLTLTALSVAFPLRRPARFVTVVVALFRMLG